MIRSTFTKYHHNGTEVTYSTFSTSEGRFWLLHIVDYTIPSITAAGWPGMRLSSMPGSPFCSGMETLFTRWSNFSASSCPVCRARAELSLWNCSRATLCHPPSDSATTGMKAITCL